MYFRLILAIKIIYTLVFYQYVKLNNLYDLGLIFMVFVYVLSEVFFRFKYFNNIKLFTVVKYVTLILSGYMFFKDNILVLGTSMLGYIIVCVELSFCLFDEYKKRKGILIFLMFSPLVFNLALLFILNEYNWISFVFLIQFFAALFGLNRIISINNDELRTKLSEQRAQCESSQKANEALILSQKKVEAINSQMIEQKIEIEKTNTQLNRISSEMYIQNELLRYISTTLDLHQLMDLVIDAIVGAIGVDTCSLIISRRQVNQYHVKSKSNYNTDVVEQLKTALNNEELASYFKSQEPVIDRNVDLEKYPFIIGRPVGSIIIIPLIRNDEIFGLLISEHATTDFFGEYNLQFFQGIAIQISIAVNNARLYKRMEEMAMLDALTGILNRRYFQNQYIELFSKIKSEKGKISIVMLDIDKFKKVNDTYGHVFGDEAIKLVARMTDKYASENGGFAGRYGGEEFVVVLPNTGLSEANTIITKMHKDIISEPLYYNKDELVYINVSFGISSYPEFGNTAMELLIRSDNAMYYSKKHGRGRITLDSAQLDEGIEK